MSQNATKKAPPPASTTTVAEKASSADTVGSTIPAPAGDKIDFTRLQSLTEKDFVSAGRKGGSGGSSLNVVNSPNNGKRVKLSNTLHETLGSPTALQVAHDGSNLIIGAKIPGAKKSFKFSPGKGTTIIYNSSLVLWLTRVFNLDFVTDDRVSRSFSDVTFETQKYDGEELTYAIINMAG